MTHSEVLRNHKFTRGLGEPQIAELAAIASEVTFRDDEVALVHGAQSQAFYLVLTGSVSVEFRTPSYVIAVQALGAGDVFGWSALLEEHDTLFEVRAREATTALRFSGVDLKAAFSGDHTLAAQLMQRALAVVATRVRATEIRFAEMCGVRV